MSARHCAGAYPRRTRAESPIPPAQSTFMNVPVPKTQQSDGMSYHASRPSCSRARAKNWPAGRMPDGPMRPSAWTQNEAKATACAAASAHTNSRVPVANDGNGDDAVRFTLTSYSVPGSGRVNPPLLLHIEIYHVAGGAEHRACYIE